MDSRRALRRCMQALVLLNLVLVHMTEATASERLLPLYALTLSAPWLARYREKLGYRMLWNAGVVAFAVLLGRHVLRANLASVLEDGLILAVLCQVHLLNNLRSNQRPDLLFFNAFLIAIITGYMGQDAGFALVFLAFAPCFVIGLQLLSAHRGRLTLPPETTKILVIDGLRRSGVLLALSLLAFVAWPRDFERRAFFSGTFELSGGPAPELEIGFNEELVLDRSGPVADSNKKALQVTVLEGEPTGVSPLWRGATLGQTDGALWRPLSPKQARAARAGSLAWHKTPGGLERRTDVGGARLRVAVLRFDQGTEKLFLPLTARGLTLAPEHRGRLLRTGRDGTVDTSAPGDVRYEVLLAAPTTDVEPAGTWEAQELENLRAYLQLPDNDRVALARELAQRLAERAPENGDQHDRVDLVRDHLARSYTYLAPGTPGAAGSLEEFLRGSAGGHCEFFASALATLLRSLDVPCRVVTGYRSTRWDGGGQVLEFGTRDAHAWVEVLDPTVGWYAVDASPWNAETSQGLGLWARLQSHVAAGWKGLQSFDSERRAALAGWSKGLPARGLGKLRKSPGLLVLLLVALAVALLAWQRRQARRRADAVLTYERGLKRALFERRPHETPRELLLRARSLDLPPERLARIEQATRRHEEARYAA